MANVKQSMLWCLRWGIIMIAMMLVLMISNDLIYAQEPTVRSTSSLAFELIAHYGGAIGEVDVQGQYAYVEMGQSLTIIDISDPAQPAEVGQFVSAAMWNIVDIEVSGNYAYVAVYAGYERGLSGLYIIDISIPTNPVEVASVDLWSIQAVEIIADIAYLAFGECDFFYPICGGGVLLVDISDPRSPVEKGEFRLTDGYGGTPAKSIAVAEEYAFVLIGFYNSQLVTIDISDPANPIEVSRQSLPYSEGIIIDSPYLYIAFDSYDETWLEIYDLASPNAPQKVASYQSVLDDIRTDIQVQDGYVYLSASYTKQMEIINVRDLESIVSVGTYDASGPLAINATHAFVGNGSRGLHIIDISTPNVPVETAVFAPFGEGYDLVVQGQYGYFLRDSVLGVLDMTDLTNVVEIGDMALASAGRQLALNGNRAYIATDAGLRIIDVTDVTNLAELGFFATNAYEVAIRDNLAYIAAGETMLQIVDVTNPASPIEIGSLSDTPAHIIALSGDYALLMSDNWVSSTAGFVGIIDISDPSSPKIVGRGGFGTEYGGSDESGNDLAVSNDRYYVAGNSRSVRGHYSSFIQEIDFADPAQPKLLVDKGSLTPSSRVTVRDDYLYTTIGQTGLCVFDVHDPAAFAEMGCDLPFYARAIAVNEGKIYTISSDGLFILDTKARLIGEVADPYGQPISDVTLTVENGPITTTTQADGTFQLTDLSLGAHTITPTRANYQFVPPSRTVSTPRYADVAQTFTMIPGPQSLTVTPSMSGALIISDTKALTTALIFPTNSVSEATTIVVTPTLATPPVGYNFAGHAFVIAAYQAGIEQPDFRFNQPVQMTIHYSDEDISFIAGESRLVLQQWNAPHWESIVLSCKLSSEMLTLTINEMANRVEGELCQIGSMALLEPINQIFLPLLFRSQ